MEVFLQTDVLYILLGIIVITIIAITLLRTIKALTTMQGYSCDKNELNSGTCDVSRIPRGTRFRLISPFIPLKRYSCHDCGRKFVRFQPLFKDKEQD